MSAKTKVKFNEKVQKMFSGTEVGALVEDFTSQVRIVAEEASGLNDRFDRLEGRFDNLENRFGSLETNVDIIKMDIEVIKHDLKNEISRDEFALFRKS